MVALAVIFRRNPFVLFSLAKSGIKTPADYVGKNIGVKIGGNEELIYRAVLAKAGIDKAKLNEIPVKFDITPLLAGTVDVWPGYLINEVLAARRRALRSTSSSPPDYGIDLYADTCSPPRNCCRRSRTRSAAFLSPRPSRRWSSAIAAPEESARRSASDYGTKPTYDHELAMMKASLPLRTRRAAGRLDGRRKLEATQKLLVDAGFQKTLVDVAAFTVEYPQMSAVALAARPEATDTVPSLLQPLQLIEDLRYRRFDQCGRDRKIEPYGAAGEFVPLLGPSGCGKSTLLKARRAIDPLAARQDDLCDPGSAHRLHVP